MHSSFRRELAGHYTTADVDDCAFSVGGDSLFLTQAAHAPGLVDAPIDDDRFGTADRLAFAFVTTARGARRPSTGIGAHRAYAPVKARSSSRAKSRRLPSRWTASAALASSCAIATTSSSVTGFGQVRRARQGTRARRIRAGRGQSGLRWIGMSGDVTHRARRRRLRIRAPAGNSAHGNPDRPLTMRLKADPLPGFLLGIGMSWTNRLPERPEETNPTTDHWESGQGGAVIGRPMAA